MLTVKGVYENGQVRLLKPINIDGPVEVQVSFPETGTPTQASLWSLYGGDKARQKALQALEGVIGLLDDLTPEQQRMFDEAVTLDRHLYCSQPHKTIRL